MVLVLSTMISLTSLATALDTLRKQMIIDLLIETNLSLVFTVSLSKETGLELVPAIAMLVYFQKLSSLGHKQYALQ